MVRMTCVAGRIPVFAVAPDGTVSTRVQAVPSGGWTDWQPLGTARIAVVPTGSPT